MRHTKVGKSTFAKELDLAFQPSNVDSRLWPGLHFPSPQASESGSEQTALFG
jgi:hypothetical protein